MTLCLSLISLNADMTELFDFQANFEQSIVDEQGKKVLYKGNVKAMQPSYAVWNYNNPIKKRVYVLSDKVVIIEPALEQAIIKRIHSNLDFFSLLKKAKKITEELYEADFENTKYFIKVKKLKIISITYTDEFENKVQIVFKDQKENIKIDTESFNPKIPKDFDIIED